MPPDPADRGSRYFAWSELACKDGTPYPEDWRATRGAELLAVADALREAWGDPLHVTSGYRTEAYNRAVNGAVRSQHVEGRALDLRPSPQKGETLPQAVRRLHRLAVRLHREWAIRLGGCGVYKSWLHIDTRPSANPLAFATWRGRGIGSEVTG